MPFLGAPDVQVTGTEIEERYLAAGSEVEVSRACLPVRVEGDLTLRDGELRFEPRRLESLGVLVPQRFTQDLLQGASFAYPVELPFGEDSGAEL